MFARLAFACALLCAAPLAAQEIIPCDERCDPDRIEPRSITVLQAAAGTLLVPAGTVMVMVGAHVESPCDDRWDERAFDPTPCTSARTGVTLFGIGGVSAAFGITLTSRNARGQPRSLTERWLRQHHFGVAPSIARRSAGLTLSLVF